MSDKEVKKSLLSSAQKLLDKTQKIVHTDQAQYDFGHWANPVTDKKGNFLYSQDTYTEERITKDTPCPRCGRVRDSIDDPDPCLGSLPGVKEACCGHGKEEGYIEFENGVTIRGWFNVEKPHYSLECDHEMVEINNDIVSGCRYCIKCGAIRIGTEE